jgi:hypothetical protein
MATLKITPELQAALGAATEEEVSAKLVEFITGTKSSIKDSSDALANKADASALAEVKAIAEGAVTAIDGVKAELPKIEEKATNAASLKAAEVLGKTGNSAPVIPAPTAGTSTVGSVDALVKAGKYEEAYNSSPELQKEFSRWENFAAYSRNAGSVQIFQKEQK